jgi:hypothetical protein
VHPHSSPGRKFERVFPFYLLTVVIRRNGQCRRQGKSIRVNSQQFEPYQNRGID